MVQGGVDRVDIMDRKETGNTHFSRHSGNQPGHPVVAVDHVGTDPGDDVVEHFALKHQREFCIFTPVGRVDPVEIEKSAVPCQMDPVVGHDGTDGLNLFFQERGQIVLKNGAVVGQRHMYIHALVKERADQGG